MKIYTYFDGNDPLLKQLIELWKRSWARHGYVPVVLGVNDAKAHPYYDTLDTEMKRYYHIISGQHINSFGMNCWHRWLAYATRQEPRFYVSDFDAINMNFPLKTPEEQLHLMDADCPFLASGSPQQFTRLCEAFVDVTANRIDEIKIQTNRYHDQEFFHLNCTSHNPDHTKVVNKYQLKLTRERDILGNGYYPDGVDDNPETYGVYHISHSNIRTILGGPPKDESYRVQLVSDLLAGIEYK